MSDPVDLSYSWASSTWLKYVIFFFLKNISSSGFCDPASSWFLLYLCITSQFSYLVPSLSLTHQAQIVPRDSVLIFLICFCTLFLNNFSCLSQLHLPQWLNFWDTELFEQLAKSMNPSPKFWHENIAFVKLTFFDHLLYDLLYPCNNLMRLGKKFELGWIKKLTKDSHLLHLFGWVSNLSRLTINRQLTLSSACIVSRIMASWISFRDSWAIIIKMMVTNSYILSYSLNSIHIHLFKADFIEE